MIRQYVPTKAIGTKRCCESGFPRRHWRQLSVALGRMGFRQLSSRWRTGQQLIQANGVTYNVYGDPQGKERPWLMDPIPLVIDQDEWAHIEQSIIQRATLLNKMLADLYGPQKLLHSGKIPSPMLFANPNFLRPVLRDHAAGWCLPSQLCGRSGALARWPLVGDFGSHAGAFRRGLCA